ncbi:DUF6169 family protein [Ferruginibacter sp. HRS2-29]|uniref:DUF6169 family protein n=1 Tax=Ferruginibacter sp. HRS2-29 TaxID=2487334 RepID=UPI0020CD6FE9|nr:DUF6169 family protein [Ferruginibacter sp. HRS2-29]MCP9750465.1 hypothetical protein [Ferruginibacter sp. HRS2-29]
MIRQIHDYYSHEFNEDDGVIAANFITKTGTQYRVYFYPAVDYFDQIQSGMRLSEASYYFGFTKVAPNEGKAEHYDPRVMNTIVNVINEFYEEQGKESILIFHCSDEGGNDKKYKRAKLFNDWFERATSKYCYKKFNEEIIVNEYTGQNGEVVTDKEYMSLIIQCDNNDINKALEEFQVIKDAIISGKG